MNALLSEALTFLKVDGERLRDKLYEYVGVPEPPHLVTDWLAGIYLLLAESSPLMQLVFHTGWAVLLFS